MPHEKRTRGGRRGSVFRTTTASLQRAARGGATRSGAMSNLGDTTTFKSFVEREAAAEKAAADGGGVAGAPPTTSSTADEKGPV